MLSIGEFSQVTRLTVKTLRYYHELGILTPVRVDEMTGYRYYDENSYNRAHGIIILKDLGFSLQEIRTILTECDGEEDLRRFIRRKIEEVRSRVSELQAMERRLSDLERGLDPLPADEGSGIQEASLNIPHAAVLPIKGRYEQLGSAYRTLFKKVGRYATGKPYCFYQDLEYREGDAGMEAVVELTRETRIEGVEYRRIENLKCVRLIYRGQYGGQGSAYMRLFDYCHTRGYTPRPPIIEHFVRGPGMILQGNPKNYITECMILI